MGDRIVITADGERAYGVRVADGLDAAGYVYTPMTALRPRSTVSVCLRAASGARQCFTAPAGKRLALPA